MKTSLFLAGRYLRPRRNVVSVITLISVIGVLLGVAVLIVVLAVMTGFTDLMKDKLLETQAHVHVRSGQVFRDPGRIVEKFRAIGLEAAPVIQYPVLAQVNNRLEAQTLLFGIDPADVTDRIQLKKMIKAGKFSLEKDEIIISTDMAARWQVKVGDRILLHAPNRLTRLVKFKPEGGVELNTESSIYLPSEFTVSALYSFGKYDFDRSVLFTNRDDAAELFGLPWGAASIVYGWVKDPFAMSAELKALRAALPEYAVNSWEEENQQLLGVLKVEKRMMFFLLVFIVLVAAFSIANTLITSVYQKTREIGILKALGASDGTIMLVFIWQGLLVGAIGSGLGTLFGAGVIWLRNDIMHLVAKITGQELFPKEFYYFNELPAHIVPGDVIFIVVCSVVLCALGGLIPAFRAAKLDPAKALRYE